MNEPPDIGRGYRDAPANERVPNVSYGSNRVHKCSQ
jgi:hypothetical protein